jgi:hypothetical protein
MTNQSVSAASAAVTTSSSLLSTTLPANLMALVNLWNTMSGSTARKLQDLNMNMVPGNPVDVPRAEIAKVLDGDLPKLQAYIANPPEGYAVSTLIAANYMVAIVTVEANYSPTLQTSNPLYFAIIQNMIPDLMLAGVTTATISAMIALVRPLVPWWQANGFSGPINIWNLISAGTLF